MSLLELSLAGVLVLVTLSGCKRAGSQKLEGHWKGQKAEASVEHAQIQANTFALGTEIVAQGNQLSVRTPDGKTSVANYVVDKEDATSLVLHTDPGGVAETFTFNEKADTMTWKIDAQRSITFKKAAQ